MILIGSLLFANENNESNRSLDANVSARQNNASAALTVIMAPILAVGFIGTVIGGSIGYLVNSAGRGIKDMLTTNNNEDNKTFSATVEGVQGEENATK